VTSYSVSAQMSNSQAYPKLGWVLRSPCCNLPHSLILQPIVKRRNQVLELESRFDPESCLKRGASLKMGCQGLLELTALCRQDLTRSVTCSGALCAAVVVSNYFYSNFLPPVIREFVLLIRIGQKCYNPGTYSQHCLDLITCPSYNLKTLINCPTD